MKQIERIKIGDRLYGFDYPMTGGIVVQEEYVQDIVLEDEGTVYETNDGFYSDKDFGRTLFMTQWLATLQLLLVSLRRLVPSLQRTSTSPPSS